MPLLAISINKAKFNKKVTPLEQNHHLQTNIDAGRRLSTQAERVVIVAVYEGRSTNIRSTRLS